MPLLLAAGLLALAGCSGVDRQQAMICVAVATAVAPDKATVSIRSVRPLEGIPNAIRVLFSASGDRRQLFADCGFAGGLLGTAQSDLVAVRAFDGLLSDRQLDMLKRWFLDEPGAVGAAIDETGWTPPRVAILDVEPPKAVGFALQQALNGLNIAAFYVPLAIAFALIHGLIGRINFAFGEIATIGSFGAIFGIQTAAGSGIGSLGFAVALAFVVAAALAMLTGWLIARSVILPLADASPRSFIVATVGLSLAISEGLRILKGPREIWLSPILELPVVFTLGPFPVMLTLLRTLMILAALVLVPLVMLLMARSPFGRSWRAVADDALMARLCGLDPAAVTGLTFILASAMAAMGGTILSLSYGTTSFAAGFMIGIKALFASLVGGAGSIGGAVAGGLLIAVLETVWTSYFNSDGRDIFVLTLVTLLFLIRPNGLFGIGRAIEEGRIIRLS